MNKRKEAYLQITRKCNNDCIFCSNPKFEKDLTLKEAKQQIEELQKSNITQIILTGGEPTQNTELFDIINYLNTKKINFKMISNGVNLSNKEFASKLKQNNLNHIHISIHHYKKDEADKLSNTKGNSKKTIQGIQNCIDQNITININTTINSINAKDLDKFISFMIHKFPQINHYVFNNLDPGCADGINDTQAKKNNWIIAQFPDFELSLKKTIDILKQNNKTFRIERVPLCYMQGFEEFSTETRKIIKDKSYQCSFLRSNKENIIRTVKPTQLYSKTQTCKNCSLNNICAGIQKEYLTLGFKKYLYPRFTDPTNIINKIKNDQQ